ncbi:Dipeptidyl aminopeptidase/acylaminoacyl peptidase [Candidatus Kryptobacter tengchongensis]|nr:Dipeptidyl aminopeptidase/acylaminoacyl peptidase [Candidatus Kryptobacter tengchongensis]
MLRKIYLVIVSLLIVFGTLSVYPQKRAITVDDLWAMKRISNLTVSPDGRWIAYVVTSYSMEENKGQRDIYLVSIDGKEVKQLTKSEGSNYSPAWSPDGKKLAFISTRDGEAQVYVMELETGAIKKITNIALGADGIVWAPDGNYIAFVSQVYPDCPDNDCNLKREKDKELSKVKAKLFTKLPFRIWNRWIDDKRSHLFTVELNTGEVIDITPGDYDTPPIDLGGKIDYAFSPDGKEICFVRNVDTMIAISTNNDLFITTPKGGKIKKITINKANDNQPIYSPDGKYIAYRAQFRAGFESDRYRLMLYDRETGNIINLTENFDRSVEEVIWSPDGKFIFFTAEDQGYNSIYKIEVKTGKIEQITRKSYNTEISITPDGRFLIFKRESINKPAEIYRLDLTNFETIQLTHHNDSLIAQLEMNSLEDFWFLGAGGTKVHGFILKPPFFEPGKKYPAVFLIHGGPQSMWADNFHYRWNAQMFASRGYVVVMINPRGSTGYGQKFTDEISGDWGGKVFEDLMKGVDYVVKNFDFIDKHRIGAAGASYGGYMINWIAGHNDKGIFKCLVSHAGVFDLQSMYGSTEELWFPEWEFKGTPWTNPEQYKKWSPSYYVKNFKTPTLVIHGQLDYRVDVSQGFMMFTALQRMGVPSKMLYFPDEGHHILKPQNAKLWWTTVLDWLDQYLKN